MPGGAAAASPSRLTRHDAHLWAGAALRLQSLSQPAEDQGKREDGICWCLARWVGEGGAAGEAVCVHAGQARHAHQQPATGTAPWWHTAAASPLGAVGPALL